MTTTEEQLLIEEIARLEKEEEAIRLQAQIKQLEQEEQSLLAQEEIGGFEAGARSLAEGLTLGFSEELAGEVVGLFRGEEAELEFERAQEARRLAGERKFGGITTTSEILGNVVTGGAAAVTGALFLPVSGLAGLAIAGVGGLALGGLSGAGKSRSETGTDQWWRDVAVGSALGFAAAPVGIAAGKLIAPGANAIARSQMAQKAGEYFRSYAPSALNVAASGRLGPGPKAVAEKYINKALQVEGKLAADEGLGLFGNKTFGESYSEIIEGAVENINQKIVKKSKGIRGKIDDDFADELAKGIEEGRLQELGLKTIKKPDDESIIRLFDSLHEKTGLDKVKFGIEELNENRNNLIKLLFTKDLSSTERASIRALIKKADLDELEFMRMIADEPELAWNGQFGDQAEKFIKAEVAKSRKAVTARHEQIESDRHILANEFTREMKEMLTPRSAGILMRFLKFGANIPIPKPGRSLLDPGRSPGFSRVGLEQGGTPAVAASLPDRGDF